jgi:hypothetical protein
MVPVGYVEVILGFVAFFVVLWLLKRGVRKAVNTGSDALMRGVLFKSEHEEGMRMINEPLVLETSACAEDVWREIEAHVKPIEGLPGVRAAIYVSSRSANRITYAYGGKLLSKELEVEVTLADLGARTRLVFKVVVWKERQGLIVAQEVLKNLRKQVRTAVAACDSASPAADSAAKGGGEKARFCTGCGSAVRTGSAFCTSCGSMVIR